VLRVRDYVLCLLLLVGFEAVLGLLVGVVWGLMH